MGHRTGIEVESHWATGIFLDKIQYESANFISSFNAVPVSNAFQNLDGFILGFTAPSSGTRALVQESKKRSYRE